jgi:hypothetical protein
MCSGVALLRRLDPLDYPIIQTPYHPVSSSASTSPRGASTPRVAS